MGLNINNATIGYDVNELQQAMTRLDIEVITEATNQMNSGMKELREQVDAVWAGQSAESFKKNMDHDKEVIIAAMHQIRDGEIKGFMNQIVNNFDEIDQNLVKERGN